jgi:hypothetical protein
VVGLLARSSRVGWTFETSAWISALPAIAIVMPSPQICSTAFAGGLRNTFMDLGVLFSGEHEGRFIVRVEEISAG